MSDNPEFGTNTQKEAILAKCPYTKILLDCYGPSDYERWSSQLGLAEIHINDQLTNLLGENYLDYCINPLVLYTHSMEVLHPQLQTHELFTTVKSIINMGFEVGNFRDCVTLVGDLTLQLESVKAIERTTVVTKESREKLDLTLCGLLNIGVHFRSLIKNDTPADPTEETPSFSLLRDDPRLDVWKNFLDTLEK
jgi:hypothetical protein